MNLILAMEHSVLLQLSADDVSGVSEEDDNDDLDR